MEKQKLSELSLYAFQPQGHGEASFFVMAESEDEARESVRNFIVEETKRADEKGYDFNPEGFGTDYYKLTVLKQGQVAANDNG